ncbi:hypothetical protein HYC85_028663 [Camellia sinensis]|uniref:CCHC-type domain-containing protein n=1 Tax=Camellia sinensis TaxID=4442 RepID=A0A7J7FVX3_CAMSI|nr:hypothetical protein HYC85_028663 [Camellia sinensis]
MSTRGSRVRMSGRSAGRGITVPLVPAVAASAVGEDVAHEIVRAVQDALARTEGGSGHALKLTKEFFRSNPPEFVGEAKPLEAESWLEQITKTLDMLRVEDEELRVSLATFQLKSDASYWWKYAKNNVGSTWVTFTEAFLAKYFLPSARERLRDQFLELRQDDTPVAQFEMRFASLSRFALELVATEERRCFEFERRLCFDIREKVAGSFWKDYYYLVEAATHVEAMVASDDGVKEETIAVSPSVPKHSRLSKGWRRKHAQSGAGSFSLPGISDSSVGRSGEVQVSDQSQSRGPGGCFVCGQQGHGRRSCPLRVNSASVSKPSQTQLYPSSRGRYWYQKRFLASPLERGNHPSSVSFAVVYARAGGWTLEREFVSDARAGSLTLERASCLYKFWERASAARAGYWTLERGSVSDARAGSLLQVGCDWEQMVTDQILVSSLERAFYFRSFARARVCSLERELSFVSSGSSERSFASSLRLCLILDLRAVFLGSSELSFARASEVYVLSFFARASILSLERASGLQT